MGKQTLLFKNIDVKRLDSVLTELHNLIFSMKHFAMLIQSSNSNNRPHLAAVRCAEEVASLCEGLQDLSIKYFDLPVGYWKKAAVYDPYFTAQEPRSPFRLYEISLDYKSRSNATLIRLEKVLRDGSIVIPPQIDKVRGVFTKLTDKLWDEKYETY